MSFSEVPVLPFRASRHLAAWIVWHATGVSRIEDAPPPAENKLNKRRKPRRRG